MSSSASQQLRQRNIGSNMMQNINNNNNNNDDDDDGEVILGAGLSAPDMLEASPSQYGVVMKLHVPVLFRILPTFVKNWIISWNCFHKYNWLFMNVRPQWKERFLILMGNYLYKFKNKGSKTPKGTPFFMETIDSTILVNEVSSLSSSSVMEYDDEMSSTFSLLPPHYTTIFTVSNFQKKHYYAVLTHDEALAWINTIQQQKQESIKRSMGHANNMPYPKSWLYFDTLGKSLLKSKERIKEKVEQYNIREMELTTSGIGYGR